MHIIPRIFNLCPHFNKPAGEQTKHPENKYSKQIIHTSKKQPSKIDKLTIYTLLSTLCTPSPSKNQIKTAKQILSTLPEGNYKFSRKDTSLAHSFLIQKKQSGDIRIFKMGTRTKGGSNKKKANTDSEKKVASGAFGRVSTLLVDIDNPKKKYVIKQLSMSKTQKKQALHVTEIKNAKNEVNILNAMGFNATLLSDIKGGIDNHSAHGKHKSYIIMDHIEGQPANVLIKAHLKRYVEEKSSYLSMPTKKKSKKTTCPYVEAYYQKRTG